jgi:hypothetical protein
MKMSASLLLSLVGFVYTTSSSSAEIHKLEGTKICESGVVKVLFRDKDKLLMMKYNNVVYVMTEKPAIEKRVRRFESNDSSLLYLHLPEKAMLLDQKIMKPIYTECRGV